MGKHFAQMYGYGKWTAGEDATWMRRLDKGRYHVIEFTNMDEACGRDNEGLNPYHIQLSEVDVLSASEKMIEGAVSYSGWEAVHELPDPAEKEMALAEILHSYGARAPLFQDGGRNGHALFRAARKESYELASDSTALEERMNRPVNKLGSTAREFMSGDTATALDRGVRAGSPEAKLVAKLHGVPDETVAALSGMPVYVETENITSRIDLGMMRRQGVTADPLAYASGFMNAMAGQGIDQPGCARDDLADAFIDGHRFGVSVKVGDTPAPVWVRQ